MLWALAGQIGKLHKRFERKVASPAVKRSLPGHTLYHFQLSAPSQRVRYAIQELGLDFPQKDILLDEQACQDLKNLGGKDRSPCLRIESKGAEQWMYDSKVIIEYLKKAAGKV